MYSLLIYIAIFEPPHGKTNNLHMRKHVFATRIVQFLYFSNPKFQSSSHLLCLYRPVCVRPGLKSHCWFSHETAYISVFLGGSCNPTSWRAEIAIPFLKEQGITFYNPVSIAKFENLCHEKLFSRMYKQRP